jgi:hypothetical protein
MDFTNQLGMTPYFFQASRADFLEARAGNRTWFWAKDVNVETMAIDVALEMGKCMTTHVMVHIDVDFYLDMPTQLSERFGLHLLYTIMPEKAASGEVEDLELDHAYFFDAEGRLHWFGAGGCEFTHNLWDYNTDHITTTQRDYFGFVTTYSVYLVDTRHCGPNRALVLLTPLKQWKRHFRALSWLGPSFADVFAPAWASRLVPGNKLKIFNPVQTYWEDETQGPVSFTRIVIVASGGGIRTSTAVCGQFLQVTMNSTMDNAIKNVSTTVKNRLQTPTCVKYLDRELDQLTKAAQSTVAHRYHRLASKRVLEALTAVYPSDFQPTQVTVDLFSDEHPAKRRLVAYMTPLINRAVELDVDQANAQRMVSVRIVDPQAALAKKPPVMSAFQLQAAREFSRLVIPDEFAHTFEPLTLDEVLDRMNKPQQQAGIARAMVSPPSADDAVQKVFPKNEAAKDESKVQRPITTSPPDVKAEYSAYIYAIHDWMLSEDVDGNRRCPWYSPGQSNPEIANRIADLCSRAEKHVVLSDYTMFDGTKSEPMRYLNYQLLCRAFTYNYIDSCVKLARKQHNNKARTSRTAHDDGEGVEFENGNATQSGSSETTWSNTYNTAFVMYLALRMTKNPATNEFYSPEEAWAAMGCNFGDDALCADLDSTKYERAAKSLGLILKCDVVKVYESGISFLSRQFGPDVWFGNANSCCDILRQVSKFHVTAALPKNVSPWQKLLEKARSFCLSDYETPVIGEFCRRVMEIAAEESTALPDQIARLAGRPRRLKHPGPASPHALAPMARWQSHDGDAQWPNQDDGWMEAYAIESLGKGGFSFDIFNKYMETMCFENCLEPPCCRERELAPVPVATIAGGELREPGDLDEEPPAAAANMEESVEGKQQDPPRQNTSSGSPKEGKASADPTGTDQSAKSRKADRAQASKDKASKPSPKDGVIVRVAAKSQGKSKKQTNKPHQRTVGAKGGATAKASVDRPRAAKK